MCIKMYCQFRECFNVKFNTFVKILIYTGLCYIFYNKFFFLSTFTILIRLIYFNFFKFCFILFHFIFIYSFSFCKEEYIFCTTLTLLIKQELTTFVLLVQGAAIIVHYTSLSILANKIVNGYWGVNLRLCLDQIFWLKLK